MTLKTEKKLQKRKEKKRKECMAQEYEDIMKSKTKYYTVKTIP